MIDLIVTLKIAGEERGISTHDILLKFAFLQDMKYDLMIIGCPELMLKCSSAGFIMHPLRPMMSSKFSRFH